MPKLSRPIIYLTLLAFAAAMVFTVDTRITVLRETMQELHDSMLRVKHVQTESVSSTSASPSTSSGQVSTDVSTWQTYRNPKYGFELRYPPDWEDLIGGRDSAEIFDIGYNIKKAQCAHGVGCSYPGEIFMRVISKNELLPRSSNPFISLDQFAQAYQSSMTVQAGLVSESLMVGNRTAVKIYPTLPISGPDSVFVPSVTILVDYSPQDVIWIEVNYFQESKNYVLSEFSAALSTFKFIK